MLEITRLGQIANINIYYCNIFFNDKLFMTEDIAKSEQTSLIIK